MFGFLHRFYSCVWERNWVEIRGSVSWCDVDRCYRKSSFSSAMTLSNPVGSAWKFAAYGLSWMHMCYVYQVSHVGCTTKTCIIYIKNLDGPRGCYVRWFTDEHKARAALVGCHDEQPICLLVTWHRRTYFVGATSLTEILYICQPHTSPNNYNVSLVKWKSFIYIVIICLYIWFIDS
jgi:hypothetical protein